MASYEQYRGTPEDHLGRKQSSAMEQETFEDRATRYESQAEAALAAGGAAATLARQEIANSNVDIEHPTKESIVRLKKSIETLRPSVMETMDDDETNRLAFTLALLRAHKGLLQ